MSDLISMMAAAAGQQGEETDPNFNQTFLLLHGDGTNGAQNNTFVDSSTNGFTITRNGNTTQGTFSPFSATDGRWSNDFTGGGGKYFTVPYSADLVFGTGDFCFQCWIYWTGGGNENNVIMNNASGGFNIKLVGSTATNWALENSYVGQVADFGTAPTKNEWHHIAVTRASGTLRAFVDGSQVYSNSNSTNFTNTSTWFIGANGYDTGAYYIDGFISNLSIVVGSAIYTSAFTPSTSPLSTSTTNQKLLVAYGNRFADFNTATTAKTVTVSGAKITPFSPFAPTAAYSASVNGGSGYFDGTGDYLTAADNVAFEPGTGDFYVACWVYHTTVASGVSPAGINVYITHSSGGISFYRNPNGKLEWGQDAVAAQLTSTNNVPINAWTHVAASRVGTTVKLWINGVEEASGTFATNYAGSGAVNVGGTSAGYLITGYISGLQLLKGTGYSSVTMPTAPPTNITNTSLLLNFTNAGIYDNTGKNNLETVGNAQIDTTTKKFGTGSIEFDGTGDYLKAPANIFIQGTEAFTVECWINLSNTSATKGIIFGVGSNSFGFRVGQSYLGNVNGLNIIRSGVADLEYCSFTFSTSTWYHIAVCRSGTTIYFFVDGQQQTTLGSGGGSYSFSAPTSFYIGCNNDTNEQYAGYIDDLRITKGVARYTTTFTPPTQAFPNL